ncbi:hypothetical protein HYH03_018022 [Edaphochlamys debaryana]|uniref:Uncharacterized protein n=1 Tax=Edaphochlamys debaryana TaxID=47281 RepID=A0A835XIT5_9CHLO|nr:hypothetical protein HYH03_018022 [Edaphochlamys debaryana]|eukprot:KAG2483081.1 hypothetical protein HYH03_018022 [Edaphochlamys debaryana]
MPAPVGFMAAAGFVSGGGGLAAGAWPPQSSVGGGAGEVNAAGGFGAYGPAGGGMSMMLQQAIAEPQPQSGPPGAGGSTAVQPAPPTAAGGAGASQQDPLFAAAARELDTFVRNPSKWLQDLAPKLARQSGQLEAAKKRLGSLLLALHAVGEGQTLEAEAEAALAAAWSGPSDWQPGQTGADLQVLRQGPGPLYIDSPERGPQPVLLGSDSTGVTWWLVTMYCKRCADCGRLYQHHRTRGREREAEGGPKATELTKTCAVLGHKYWKIRQLALAQPPPSDPSQHLPGKVHTFPPHKKGGPKQQLLVLSQPPAAWLTVELAKGDAASDDAGTGAAVGAGAGAPSSTRRAAASEHRGNSSGSDAARSGASTGGGAGAASGLGLAAAASHGAAGWPEQDGRASGRAPMVESAPEAGGVAGAVEAAEMRFTCGTGPAAAGAGAQLLAVATGEGSVGGSGGNSAVAATGWRPELADALAAPHGPLVTTSEPHAPGISGCVAGGATAEAGAARAAPGTAPERQGADEGSSRRQCTDGSRAARNAEQGLPTADAALALEAVNDFFKWDGLVGILNTFLHKLDHPRHSRSKVLGLRDAHAGGLGLLHMILAKARAPLPLKSEEQLRREVEAEGIEEWGDVLADLHDGAPDEVQDKWPVDAGGPEGLRRQGQVVAAFECLAGAWPGHEAAFKQLLLQRDPLWQDTALTTCVRHGLLHVLEWLLPAPRATVLYLTHIKGTGLLGRTVVVGTRELQASQLVLCDLSSLVVFFARSNARRRLERAVAEVWPDPADRPEVCPTAAGSKDELKRGMERLVADLAGLQLQRSV